MTPLEIDVGAGGIGGRLRGLLGAREGRRPAVVAVVILASIIFTTGDSVPLAALVAYINDHGLCPLDTMVQMAQLELRRLVGGGQYITLAADGRGLDMGNLVFLMTAKMTTGALARHISWSTDKFKYAIDAALAVTTSLAHRRLKSFRERRSQSSVLSGLGALHPQGAGAHPREAGGVQEHGSPLRAGHQDGYHQAIPLRVQGTPESRVSGRLEREPQPAHPIVNRPSQETLDLLDAMDAVTGQIPRKKFDEIDREFPRYHTDMSHALDRREANRLLTLMYKMAIKRLRQRRSA